MIMFTCIVFFNGIGWKMQIVVMPFSLWENYIHEYYIGMQLISSKQLICNYITTISWIYEKKILKKCHTKNS
jgi:hypothetical protein